MTGYISVVLSHQVWGTRLQQPHEPDRKGNGDWACKVCIFHGVRPRNTQKKPRPHSLKKPCESRPRKIWFTSPSGQTQLPPAAEGAVAQLLPLPRTEVAPRPSPRHTVNQFSPPRPQEPSRPLNVTWGPSLPGPQKTPNPHFCIDQGTLENTSGKSALAEDPGSQNQPKGHPRAQPVG